MNSRRHVSSIAILFLLVLLNGRAPAEAVKTLEQEKPSNDTQATAAESRRPVLQIINGSHRSVLVEVQA
jgi:hypothetical protein